MTRIVSVAALVAGLALAAGPAAAAPAGNQLPPAAQRTIIVATYNIHHAAGADGVLDLERIATVLERTGAEVIGLQEVDNHWGARSEFMDQAQWLAYRLGMSVCYSANLDREPLPGQTERQQYGTAILSAYQLKNCASTLLPNHPGGEQRGLAQADVKVRGVDFRFYNTHLTHNSQPGRVAQAEAINGIIGDDTVPAILVGDLNARPDSPEYSLFTRHVNDVWPAVGEGAGFTLDSENPTSRIDYVLTSEGINPMSAEVVQTIASDHLPVVAQVTLPHPREVTPRR